MGKKSAKTTSAVTPAAAPAAGPTPPAEPAPAARKSMSRSERAGLSLTSSRINTLLKSGGSRVSGAASIYLTAAVEELLDGVLEAAVAQTSEGSSNRVGVSAVAAAIRSEDLKKIFSGYTLVTDRVLPRPGDMLLTSKAIAKKRGAGAKATPAVAAK